MKTTQTKLILFVSIFIVLLDNFAFFRHISQVYPVNFRNVGFMILLAVQLTASIALLITLISSKYTIKPTLILMLVISPIAAYFMDNYNVVIDHTMIANVLQTSFDEAGDLFNIKLVSQFLLLGLLPSVIVYNVRVDQVSWREATATKVKIAFLCLIIILGPVLIFSKLYASFFREHKPLRYYTNPTYLLYSMGKYINGTFNSAKIVVHPLGEDAHIPITDTDRELIILVIGEAVRADRFSLNGYSKETNPLLQKEDVISFSNVYSSGTSTAYSVPCMFSNLSRGQFDQCKGQSNENLLDVLEHAKVHVLWRDNNSDSKGVALRVPYQDFKRPGVNSHCDIECRDEGMLDGLQEYIDNQKGGDVLIVLHQMGNHGPAYYKRYPAAFERFLPVCKTNQLEECTTEEISNAYDNAVLYTDYFLAEVIKLLKKNSTEFETAMVYMSDHGESLGEYGIYLHGLPYAIAPEQQKHIATALWFGDRFEIDKELLKAKSAQHFSHENLFHTVLGLMEIETSVYDKSLDIVHK